VQLTKQVGQKWIKPVVEGYTARAKGIAKVVGYTGGVILATELVSHFIDPMLRTSNILTSNINLGTAHMTFGFGSAYVFNLLRGKLKHKLSIALSIASAVPAYQFVEAYDKLLRAPNPLTHISLTNPEVGAGYMAIGFVSGMIFRGITRRFEKSP
jgi:hypothetical protein